MNLDGPRITITVVYFPTNESIEEMKELFLEHPQEVINITPKHHILWVIGDFNAKVSRYNK